MTIDTTRAGIDITGRPAAYSMAAYQLATKTKRGVNLGCGTVTLPRPRPVHQQAVPEELYTDPAILWDNVDRNQEPGVTHTVDLFTYPWSLPSNTYDVALASHIVEHIPHHILWNGAEWGDYTLGKFSPAAQELITTFGQIIPNHPLYQDGWFAWFSELHRIMKPGGVVYIVVPFAWSHSGISDPTHTRYLTLASFNYFNNPTQDDPTFKYRMAQRWKFNLEETAWSPHERAMADAKNQMMAAALEAKRLSLGAVKFDEENLQPVVWQMSHSQINTIVDLTLKFEAVK